MTQELLDIEDRVKDMRDYAYSLASMGDLTQVDLAVVIQAQQKLVEYLDDLLEQPSLMSLVDPVTDPDRVADFVLEKMWKGDEHEPK